MTASIDERIYTSGVKIVTIRVYDHGDEIRWQATARRDAGWVVGDFFPTADEAIDHALSKFTSGSDHPQYARPWPPASRKATVQPELEPETDLDDDADLERLLG